MKILVTGAKGFVRRNLCSQLKNIKDQKARWYDLPEPIDAVFEYDIDSAPEEFGVTAARLTLFSTLLV